MIIPLLFNIDLLILTRLAMGEVEGEVTYLPCRALAVAKKDGWMYGITFWLDKGGLYGGEETNEQK